MEMVRGNRAIRDHETNNKELHLFKIANKGFVRYEGQMVYVRDDVVRQPDVYKSTRNAIVFTLRPIDEQSDVLPTEDLEPDFLSEVYEESAWGLPADELRSLALSRTSATVHTTSGSRAIYHRSNLVRVYVLSRAGRVCEGCKADAPFATPGGFPYLEPHHAVGLAKGGPDDPRNVIALCPNCHRRVHYGRDGKRYNAELIRHLQVIEPDEVST